MDVTAGVHVERQPVTGECPECGAAALARYPVLAEGGWYEVVKCQACLASVARERWRRLGHVDRDHADRVAGMPRGARP